MGNALIELKNKFRLQESYKIGTVTGKKGEMLAAEMETGALINVWGQADIGDTVLIKDKQVLARIDKKNTINIYIA